MRARGKPPTAPPPLGRLYDLRGRRLWLHRSGAGHPAAVFLAGAGTVGLDYLNVHQRASAFTTSVLYDRSGTGWSDPAPSVQSAADTADELRALLSLAELRPPYVLIGHSLGGLFARLCAKKFPGDVLGLVLLDPAHENYEAYMPEELNALRREARGWIAHLLRKHSGRMLGAAIRFAPGLVESLPPVRRYRELYRRLFTAEMVEWPTWLRDQLVEHHVSLDWFWAGIREAQNAESLYNEARMSGPLPNVPTIILCSMGTDEFRRAVLAGESESLLEAELAAKRRLYDDLASSVRSGEVRTVDAGHLTIHFRHPEAVAQAICDVLGR